MSIPKSVKKLIDESLNAYYEIDTKRFSLKAIKQHEKLGDHLHVLQHWAYGNNYITRMVKNLRTREGEK